MRHFQLECRPDRAYRVRANGEGLMDVQRRDFLVTGTLAAAAVAAATPALAQATQVAAAGPGEARDGSVLPGDEKIQYTAGTEVKKLTIINPAELEIETEK